MPLAGVLLFAVGTGLLALVFNGPVLSVSNFLIGFFAGSLLGYGLYLIVKPATIIPQIS